MSCEQCLGLERVFGARVARNDLRRYRRNGPSNSTRVLIEALEVQGVAGASLIDIGGGVGAIPLALLRSGAAGASLVDASPAYLAIAEEEARRQGLVERMTFRHGDFVSLAPDIPSAEVVTLDRVICCYDDVRGLIISSASHATRFYGLVYPRDTWWNRAGVRAVNLFLGFTRLGYRSYIHPQELVESLIEEQGHQLLFHRKMGIWQIAVYRRG